MKTSYSEMLRQRVKDTISLWENSQQLSHEEIYRFFHSLKGTSGTVGLHEWSKVAEQLVDLYDQTNKETVSSVLRKIALDGLRAY